MKYGNVLIDLEGQRLTTEEKELLRHPNVCGVILFTRNYESPQQLSALTESIRDIRSPFIIATDHEGGRVQRFRNGFTRLPSMRSWGENFSARPNEAKAGLQTMTYTMASELMRCGVNVSFAPVLDIDYGVSDIIGERSFHSSPSVVSELGECVLQAMHQYQMPTIGKHFPGHGGVAADSHLELPVDLRSHKEIFEQDIYPFQKLLPDLDAIMPAFVKYPACDDKPAVFSRYWLTTVLREQMGYNGVILGDDLNMEGAACEGSHDARALAALEAGCDMVCICNNRDAAIKILNAVETYTSPKSDVRIEQYISKIRSVPL